MPDDYHILWRMVFAYRRLVLIKDHIQGPVERIFDRPMGAHRVRNLFSIRWQAADEKTPLSTDASFKFTSLFNHSNRFEPTPFRFLLQPAVLMTDDAYESL
jgi:hypothetical protein